MELLTPATLVTGSVTRDSVRDNGETRETTQWRPVEQFLDMPPSLPLSAADSRQTRTNFVNLRQIAFWISIKFKKELNGPLPTIHLLWRMSTIMARPGQSWAPRN